MATTPNLPDPDYQARLILDHFATWLAESPGRRVVLSRDGDEWRATLEEARSSGGSTLQDAAAQIASVVSLEVEATAAG